MVVRRWFEGPPASLGALPELQEQYVRLGPGSDRFEVVGLPHGILVAEVASDGFAKTFSSPIDNRLDPALPRRPRWQTVDLVLASGSALRGRVLAEDGRPLAGASIRTQHNGAVPDSPLGKLLQDALPDFHTQTIGHCDADGSFVHERPRGGRRLPAVHSTRTPAPTVVGDLAVPAGQTITLPDVVLPRGAVVEGRVTVTAAHPARRK